MEGLARFDERLRLLELEADANGDQRLVATLAHMREATTVEEIFALASELPSIIAPNQTRP